MGNVTNLRPPWRRGQSGNPGGKSRGTRNKFSEAFLRDFYASWEKNGAAVIERVIAEDPVAYLRIMAGLVAKFDVDQQEDLTRERIRRAIAICDELENAITGSGAGDSEPGIAGELPPLPEATSVPSVGTATVGAHPEMAAMGAVDGAADGRR